MNWAVILAGFLSGVIGAMGMGGGGVLLIYLTVFASVQQRNAQGINLLFFLPIAITAIIIYAKKGEIEWKTVLPMAAAGLVGAGLGVLLANGIGEVGLGKLFAVFLIILGIQQFFAKEKKA